MKTTTIVPLLLTFLAITSVISMFLLLQIDNVVKTLDSYGLQYDNAWMGQYSKLTLTTFGLILFDVALATYYLFFREHPKAEASRNRSS